MSNSDSDKFIEKVISAFRDQPVTPDVALKIHEMHMIELEKVKKELLQLINKVFE